MAVFRVEKTKDYTVMSTFHLKEKGMSLRAKGLLSIMLSLPDDWDYSIMGLCAITNKKESVINNTLNELKKFGYLQVIKLMPNETNSGRIEYLYIVFEKQTYSMLQREDYINILKQGNKKQGVEKQDLEKQDLEKQGQYNINKPINKKQSINKRKKESDYDSIINEKIQNEELKANIYEFIKMRKLIKKPLTNRALELMIEKLKTLSNNNSKTAIKILNQSIVNSWQGIFALKDEKSSKTFTEQLADDNELIMEALKDY